MPLYTFTFIVDIDAETEGEALTEACELLAHDDFEPVSVEFEEDQ